MPLETWAQIMERVEPDFDYRHRDDISKETGLPIGGEEKYSKQEPGGTMSAVNVDEIQQAMDKIDEATVRVYNDTLCPRLWDEYQHLDPRVRVNLLRMAYDFYEKTNFKAPIIDIYLMGSAANYNWTPDSDADVHIIIDCRQLQMPPETAKKAVKTAGVAWNGEHKVSVMGHKVEINIQNVTDQKLHVTGIYSLVNDKWVRQPSYQNPVVDKTSIQTVYSQMKKFITAVVESNDHEAMKQAKKYLDAFRQYGLDTRGELSIENIVFKILRARGLIKGLKDAITATYDKEMTVVEGSAKDDIIKSRLAHLTDDTLVVIVQRDDSFPQQNYVQVDEFLDGETYFSSNPESMKKYGYDMPSSQEILSKIPQGQYKLSDIRKRLKQVGEVTQKDIHSKFPLPSALYKGDPKFNMMTLDNLKSMREKAASLLKYAQTHEDPAGVDRAMKKFILYDTEMKKRMAYINKPVMEMAQISKHDKTVMANDKLLRDMDVEEVRGNIVFIRSESGGFVNPGFTILYFMDSDESAKMMAEGKIPYLMVPQGSFYSGGNPITDIWKKKYQKPGTEHILGVLEGNSNSENIFINMLTVRPGYQRNKIGTMLLKTVKNHFPDAKISTSSATPAGEKFKKANDLTEDRMEGKQDESIAEGYGAGIPEEDRLHIPGERWRIKSKDAPKTPKMPKESITEIAQSVPSHPQSHSDMIGKLNHEIEGLVPSLSDPIEAKRELTDGVLSLAKASKSFLKSVSENNRDDGVAAGEFIFKKIPLIISLIVIWAMRFAQEHPERQEAIGRVSKELLVHLNQIPSQLETIYTSIIQYGNVINGANEIKHLNEILRAAYESLNKFFEIGGGKELKEVLLESPEMKTLKKNKKPLADEERQMVMSADATWHHGPNGEKTPAVWKAIINGKTWYVCNTHRAYQCKPTLKGAISAFKFIKTTA